MAVDGSGNVYVADTGNSAVKEMPAGCASSSCVTTLGGGFSLPNGVAVDGSGNVYVADTDNNAVKEMPAGCASSSCVTTLGGGFSYPDGVAVDGSGNVYVADYGNSAVKEMPAGCASSSCVTALGGGFSYPSGVAVDGSGNVYVADAGNNAVKEMPAGCASSSCVTTLGGGFNVSLRRGGGRQRQRLCRRLRQQRGEGDARRLRLVELRDHAGRRLQLSQGVAVDGSGNVYVADTGNNAVKEIMTRAVNFFTVPVGTASAAMTLTFTFDSAGSLNSTTPYQVLTQGAKNLDFNAAATQESNVCNGTTAYTAGESCTVNVTFTPTEAGPRYGAVAAERWRQHDCHSLRLRHGRRPAGRLQPGHAEHAGRRLQRPEGVAVDGSGNVYVADFEQQRGEGDARRMRLVELRDHAGRRLQRSRRRGGGRRRQRLCRRYRQ